MIRKFIICVSLSWGGACLGLFLKSIKSGITIDYLSLILSIVLIPIGVTMLVYLHN